MHGVNLIPMARLEQRRRRRRIRQWFAASAAYLVLLLLVYAALLMVWGRGNRTLADQLSDARAQVVQTQQAIDELVPALTAAQMNLEASRAVSVQPDWSLLLALLAQECGEDVVLNRVGLTKIPDDPSTEPSAAAAVPANGVTTDAPAPGAAIKRPRFKLEVHGFALNQQAVSAFVLALEQTQLFNWVKLDRTSRQAFGTGNAIAFRVECEMGRKGDPSR